MKFSFKEISKIYFLILLLFLASFLLTACDDDEERHHQPEPRVQTQAEIEASKAAAAKAAEEKRLQEEHEARSEKYRKQIEWNEKPNAAKVADKLWELNVALCDKLMALEKNLYYEDLGEQPEGEIVQIFKIGSDLAVFNEGTNPTVTFDHDYYVTEIWTYHYNNGQGTPAGGMEIRSADGTVYGPWYADLENKFYWVVKPNQIIPAGEYTIIDSYPLTWSQNSETQGQGMAWAYGVKVE